MNITANLLGLGNAATPLGLEAMRQIEKEDKTKDTASRNMIMFVVMNTASMQLIPSTIATLRLENGSKEPLDILPAVLISSALSLIVGIIMVFIFDNSKKGGIKH
jgi:spore maturation protein A